MYRHRPFIPSDSLPGTVGRAVMGMLHSCDGSGEGLPTGEAGIVYCERDTAPFACHDDAEKTRRAQHPKHPG
jgi:fatty-acyl-CoA synthase